LSIAGPAFALGSPTGITADVPAVSTPAILTPRVAAPDPTVCATVKPIGVPVGAEVQGAGIANNVVGGGSLTPQMTKCAAVPSLTVPSLGVAAKTVDVQSVSVPLPAGANLDQKGADSQVANMASADADRHDNGAQLNVGTTAADFNTGAGTH